MNAHSKKIHFFFFLFMIIFNFESAFPKSHSHFLESAGAPLSVQGSRRGFNKYFILADMDILRHDFSRAIDDYYRGLLLPFSRENMEVWDDLGFAYLKKGEIEKAKKSLINSIKFHHENYNSRLYLALVYLINDELDLAAEQLGIIEKNIYFDDRWIAETKEFILRKQNGEVVHESELRRIKGEKGVYLQKVNESEAVIHVDAFDERNEGTFYYVQGIVDRLRGNLGNAEEKLLSALKANYDEIEVRIQLAELYLLNNQIDEASKNLDVIMAQKGKDVQVRVLFLWGCLKEKQELDEEALAFFQKSFSLDPSFIQSKKNIARVYYNQRKYAEAVKIWEEILKLTPGDLELKKELDQTRELLQINVAGEKLKEMNLLLEVPFAKNFNVFHRLRNHDNGLLLGYHDAFFKTLKKGEINNAIRTLENALFVDEQSFVINHNLALIYFDTADLENFDSETLRKAETYCARALWFGDFHQANNKIATGCHLLMGDIYYLQKRYEEAKMEYGKILEIDPLHAAAHYLLGCIYQDLGDSPRAEQAWEKAIECEKEAAKTKEEKISDDKFKFYLTVTKRPISFLAHMSLGLLYLDQKSYEKALNEFQKATIFEPKNPNPFYELGKIYLSRGETEKAIDHFEKYIYLGGKKEKEVNDLLKSLKKAGVVKISDFFPGCREKRKRDKPPAMADVDGFFYRMMC